MRWPTPFLAALVALGPGCASIMSGSSQRVRIDTHPDAKTVVDGRTFVGSTSIDLPRSSTHVLHVEKSGYETQELSLSPRMNGWVWGNLVLGPLFPLGVVIDALTGAIHDLTPRSVRVSLDAERPKKVEEKPPRPPPIARTLHPDWVLAVMEMQRLRGEEPADDVLGALSEQLRVRLAADRWRVIDRTRQETQWREIVEAEKHNSYRRCYETSCQIPLGRALAASHVLRTSVARFGEICVLGAELYDLETEVAVAAGTAEGACSEEALLGAAHRLLKNITDSASSDLP